MVVVVVVVEVMVSMVVVVVVVVVISRLTLCNGKRVELVVERVVVVARIGLSKRYLQECYII